MWQLRDGVHPVLTDEGGAILNEHTGRWTYLTPTAASAALVLLAAADPDRAAVHFAANYGLPHERAAADVQAVAEALAAQGLVRTKPSRRLRGWRR
ncbi:hypothetical protein I5Q34_09550 [Streptomyces sp. AV19]|uniref:PqqD family peptide modification chaperone n=1 Tax=Streptomyces sp. AV19 TaxID=2793068 RepID=UPI0018FEFE0E|nr:hypothetical protein [Streptomyces sp. AV19]MBH1934529.1 hypothetical protein [Streptomyces sp. AV19]MDG4536947.1 hypothetical protein [Streptomyces sp. AV19]